VTLPPWRNTARAAPKCISGRTSYLRVRLAFHPYPQVIPMVCNPSEFGPPRACSARFTLPMGGSPGFGSVPRDSSPFRTRFRSGSAYTWLNLAATAHSSAHSTKGTPSPGLLRAPTGRKRTVSGSLSLPSTGVLFTVPSRYWCPIGRWWYLALGGGPPRFPPPTTWRAVLTQIQHAARPGVAYGALTLCRDPFQQSSAARTPPRETAAAASLDPVQPHRDIAGRLCRRGGLGSSPFARRY
jgi:hypothetical protein